MTIIASRPDFCQAAPAAPERPVAAKLKKSRAADAAGTYTVQPGDYLTRLARERGLAVAQLVAWNGLRSETVVPGQRLRLTAPAADAPHGAAATPNVPVPNPADVPRTHLVQPGDTLYNISRRFGVSVQELRELNHLTSDEVKLGQKLVVRG